MLPRTERVKWVPGAGEKWRRAAGVTAVEPLGATEVDGLRPYRPGTPASRIHWPALARGRGAARAPSARGHRQPPARGARRRAVA